MITEGKCVVTPTETAWASYKVCSKRGGGDWRVCGCVGVDVDVRPR